MKKPKPMTHAPRNRQPDPDCFFCKGCGMFDGNVLQKIMPCEKCYQDIPDPDPTLTSLDQIHTEILRLKAIEQAAKDLLATAPIKSDACLGEHPTTGQSNTAEYQMMYLSLAELL